jgi:hypothetical protein
MKTVDLLRRATLPVYRLFSLVTLYTVLLMIVGYALTLAFYISSGSWMVPFVAHNSDDKVLTLLAQVTNGQQTISTLSVANNSAQESLKFNRSQLGGLMKLEKQLDATINSQRTVWGVSGDSLSNTSEEKKQVNQALGQDASKSSDLRKIIEKDLAVGLITKGDAQQQINALDQFLNTTTDSKVNETLLSDSIRQHYMTDVSAVTILAQKAQLEVQIAQIASDIRTAEQQIAMNTLAMDSMRSTIQVAKQSPYYEAASTGKMLLAIVPYNDKNPTEVGAPVYTCFIGMAFCRRAGQITAVYKNEEMFEHPILRFNMRGYIVKIDVDDKSSKSTTLFLRKPLLF